MKFWKKSAYLDALLFMILYLTNNSWIAWYKKRLHSNSQLQQTTKNAITATGLRSVFSSTSN